MSSCVYSKTFKFPANYFGLDAVDENTILKSGTEYLNAFLNMSNCCTLCIKNNGDNTQLEANDTIVSELKNVLL